METIKPINNNLVVRILERNDKEDDIFLGYMDDTSCGLGEVLFKDENIEKISEKDIIVYRKMGQDDFRLNGEKIHIISENSVKGIFKNN